MDTSCVLFRPRVTNAEISTSIKRRRLKWFGHVARMEHTRLPYLSVFHPIPNGEGWVRPFRGVRNTWRRKLFKDVDCRPVHRIVNRNANYFKTNYLTLVGDIAMNRSNYVEMVDKIVGC